ncbi:MAG: hypothetical protein ACOCRX_10320 [Candidatus Woesearchaeota archaeon]
MGKRKKYLNTYTDVKRFLADIAYRLDIGELDRKTALALKEICNGATYTMIQETNDKKAEEIKKNNEIMKTLIQKMEW